MGGDDKLTAEESCRVLQKLEQLQLTLWRKAVLRLVQQIQSIFLDFVRKIEESALAVGLLADVVYQPLTDIA